MTDDVGLARGVVSAPSPEDDGRDGEQYAIGELAETFGVTPRAIRFYEDQGLLSPRRVGTMRIYGRRDRARLGLILRGKRLGFSLSDIGELLDLYDVDENHVAQLLVTLRKGRAHIADLVRQAEEIRQIVGELRATEATILEMLARHGLDPGDAPETLERLIDEYAPTPVTPGGRNGKDHQP